MTSLGRNAAALAALARRRWRRGRDAAAARRAAAFGRARPLLREIEPLAIGDAETARRLAQGEVALGGARARVDPADPWRARPPSDAWRDALHGFHWLEDIHAAGRRDRAALTGWVFAWLRRHGGGSGPGWRAELAGRRLAELAAAAPLLLQGADRRQARRLLRALGAHRRFLAARWRAAETPLGRLEAATGLLLGALATVKEGRALRRAIAAAGRAAEACVRIDGGVASRRPADLARAFDWLAWGAHALEAAGIEPDARHAAALRRAGPALRALRLGDGGLARFHGGGDGADGLLDQALALAGHKARGARRDAAMGFLRLQAGGVALVMDAAPPPGESPTASATALAFEMSAGRRRLIASVGPGAGFGGDWPVAARATAAFSAVEAAGASAARLAPTGLAARAFGRPLVSGPTVVMAERAADEDGHWLLAEHDGYLARFGLILARRLNLAPDGTALKGEDTLSAPTAAARRRFDAAAEDGGVPFVARFHLHPDVAAERMGDGRGVRLAPDQGPGWRFGARGGRVALTESVWLGAPGTAPRKTLQIVVAARAEAYFGRVSWAFEREDAL